ncbi:hypothetical protein BDM02DRAFT_3122840 [Thelephora ganbajun]|uniref:Uncharacterized protein n=1 Tax=Thelephora ganbajun TaxID=370292 RepID=A0ACB6Z3J6_THEGA|nr:hypothetical protein BDM02DRAFT_3122840 [Thelephora ganbajun]
MLLSFVILGSIQSRTSSIPTLRTEPHCTRGFDKFIDIPEPPSKALLRLESDFSSEEPPLPKFLPKTPENLQNIVCIASDGPSGILSVWCHRIDWAETVTVYSDRTILRLNQCNNLPFTFALNPNQNSSKLAVCPKLEDLVLYVDNEDSFAIGELMSMTKLLLRMPRW